MYIEESRRVRTRRRGRTIRRGRTGHFDMLSNPRVRSILSVHSNGEREPLKEFERPSIGNYSLDCRTGETGECSICLNVLNENGRFLKLKNCGHILHEKCMEEWIKSVYKFKHVTCPLCRCKI